MKIRCGSGGALVAPLLLLLSLGCGGSGGDEEEPPANTAPTADISASATSGIAPVSITFDGSASADPDGTVTAFAWDFGDGGSAAGSTATHAYTSSGTFTVTLTVTDDLGATGTATVEITVDDNIAPTPVLGAAPLSGNVPLEVAFDASGSSDADGTVTSFSWSFGDGATSAAVSTSHTYTEAGAFTVTLVVEDDRSAQATTTVVVDVNGFPTAEIETDVTSGFDPLEVSFSGAGSSDDDGSIASFSWDFGDGATATGSDVSHVFEEVGSFDVVLTVTDDDGAEDTATVTIEVARDPANALPAIMDLLLN